MNAPGELRATEGSASPLLRANEGSASPPPNIVLILADDLGYGDCSVTNSESKIRTPHIEQLAKEGLSFSDAHSAASTCTPSRYGLLTGINPVCTGVLNTLLAEGRAIISKDEKTIAHLLKDQGYATHVIGKWHLGTKDEYMPTSHGFDQYFGIPYSVRRANEKCDSSSTRPRVKSVVETSAAHLSLSLSLPPLSLQYDPG